MRAIVGASSRGEGRVGVGAREAADVEVVDDLGEQVVKILDERGAGVGVAGDAEAVEHHLAELVGGGDRGRVEAAERLAHPVEALGERPSSGASDIEQEQAVIASASCGPPPRGGVKARSAATSRSRTRSRSSWDAARPKVMTSISSSRPRPRRPFG